MFFKNNFIIIFVAFLYIALSVYIPNYRLILDTIFGDETIYYKLAILFFVLKGFFTVFSLMDVFLLIVTGILLGINLVLIIQTKKRMTSTGVKFLVGGGGIFSLVSAGCASCGYSVLSVLGLGTSLSFLPFGGKFLYFISIGALLFSIIYMTRKLNISKNCEL